MTVAAGYTVVASDYDSLASRIVAEAGRRSMAAPTVPNIDPNHTISAYTFNLFRNALSYLNTLGGITLPGAKVAGQSIVTAWEAQMLFTAIGVLEGQQLTCKFSRNQQLFVPSEWIDGMYGISWTGSGGDNHADGGTTALTFSIGSNNVVTINNMELYRYQQDGYYIDYQPGVCSNNARYWAKAGGGALGYSAYGTWMPPSCLTTIYSSNFYVSGGKEHLDVIMKYPLTPADCTMVYVRYKIMLTAECNGSITAISYPDMQYSSFGYNPYIFETITGCVVPPVDYGYTQYN